MFHQGIFHSFKTKDICFYFTVIILVLFTIGATPPCSIAHTISDYYVAPDLEDLNPQIPGYGLPLSLSDIANYNNINSSFQMTEGAKALIRANGFVVGDWTERDDFVEIYKKLKDWKIPIFITSDTLLHLYHIQFDETLMRIEEDEFYWDMRLLSQTFYHHFLSLSGTYTGDMAEAARRNAAFFALGYALLGSSLPPGLDPEMTEKVNAEIALIQAHECFTESPLFSYKEDYSQYVPRGHYTRSETLKKYFKAMMWYGRMAFLIKEDPDYCQWDFCPALVSPQEARLQTLQAALIAASLPHLDTSEDMFVQYIWDRIYSVTSFYVGIADDLTPYEYLDALQKIFNGEGIDLEALASDEDLFLAFKSELALMRSPEIFGGTGNAGIFIEPGETLTPEQLDEILEKTKGLRLMGQRFIPDSYMFGQLVAPNVDLLTGDQCFTTVYMVGRGWGRGFPRGLDIMDILGSNRARGILKADGDTAYKNYENQRRKMIHLLEALSPADWQRNLYWGWLYCLRPLLKEYGEGYQSFMKTGAWQDKQLNAALASWTELRHDTILYAKQSYTPLSYSIQIPSPPVVGYVEPVPEFYARLLGLTRMTRRGLEDLSVLDQQGKSRLLTLESLLNRIFQISIKEVENQPLTNDDYEFINDFGKELEGAVLGVSNRGTSTVLVADVHTDSNSEKVLEEGVGFADLILACYKVPDGRILMGAGPVFTYYEFKHPMSDRLTDEAWKEMLQGSQKPDPPSWTYSYALGDGFVDLREEAPDLTEPTEPIEDPPGVSPPVTPWGSNPFLPLPGAFFPIFSMQGWSIPGMTLNPYALSNPLGTKVGKQSNLIQNQQTAQSLLFSPYNNNMYMPATAPFLGYPRYKSFSFGGLQWQMNQWMIPGFSGHYQYPYIPTYVLNIAPDFDF